LADRNGAALENEVTKVRAEIALAQAKKWCPKLIDSRWWPIERDLQGNPLEGFDRRRLRELPVWQSGPPANPKLLKETWDLLLATVKERFQVGRDAITGQHRCVVDLKVEMARRIRRDAQLGANYWCQKYIADVARDWSGRGEAIAAVRAYPKLFAGTEEQIRGIVHEAIQCGISETKRRMVYSRKNDFAWRLEKDLPDRRRADADSLAKALRELV